MQCDTILPEKVGDNVELTGSFMPGCSSYSVNDSSLAPLFLASVLNGRSKTGNILYSSCSSRKVILVTSVLKIFHTPLERLRVWTPSNWLSRNSGPEIFLVTWTK